MRPNYKPPFSRFVEKAHKPLQLAIADAAEEICTNPYIGVAKASDLAEVRVYKFTFNRQEYLIAYHYGPCTETAQGTGLELPVIDFYLIGPHENFYAELKRYLRSGR